MSNSEQHSKAERKKEAKAKAARYCAYQERTQQQVREKLRGLGAGSDLSEEIISELITENFINEERYARSFAGGKFRLKKWGRLKIERELSGRGLSDYCIRKGMEEIAEDEYNQVAEDLIRRKLEGLSGDPAAKRLKLTRYLAYKGYEYDLINQLVSMMLER